MKDTGSSSIPCKIPLQLEFLSPFATPWGLTGLFCMRNSSRRGLYFLEFMKTGVEHSPLFLSAKQQWRVCKDQDVFFISFYFLLLRAAPAACEDSQAGGLKSELQLLASTTATAMWDLSLVFDLHHSLWQRQILNPLSEAEDGTCVLMDPRRVCYH